MLSKPIISPSVSRLKIPPNIDITNLITPDGSCFIAPVYRSKQPQIAFLYAPRWAGSKHITVVMGRYLPIRIALLAHQL
jgi:hypothetical protein